MRKCLFICVFGILLCSCHSGRPFRELDRCIEMSDYYDRCFTARMDSLKLQLISCEDTTRRWEINREIFAGYLHYCLDSCFRYSDAMLELSGADKEKFIISKAGRIKLFRRRNCYMDASEICNSLDTSGMTKDAALAYYSAAHGVYSFLSTHSADTDLYKRKADECVRRLWEVDSTLYESINVKVSHLIAEHEYEEALRIGTRLLQSVEDLRDESRANYIMGLTYKYMGKYDQAVPYLIKSAIADIKIPIKNATSLYLLAEILYDKGDVRRADRYMKLTIDNSIFCGYEQLVVRNSQLDSLIGNKIIGQNRIRFLSLLVISVLGLVFSLVLIVLLRKLRLSHKRIAKISANKNILIAKYLELSADYIYNVDTMRQNLRKTAKDFGAEAVVELLKTAPYADSEFVNFRNTFDEFFLWIYPDFVRDLNTIMLPCHKFDVPGDKLTAELRMLALIWLGITDRQKISRILHLSVQSIYTYHSIIQKGSIYPEGNFDARLQMLGK